MIEIVFNSLYNKIGSKDYLLHLHYALLHYGARRIRSFLLPLLLLLLLLLSCGDGLLLVFVFLLLLYHAGGCSVAAHLGVHVHMLLQISRHLGIHATGVGGGGGVSGEVDDGAADCRGRGVVGAVEVQRGRDGGLEVGVREKGLDGGGACIVVVDGGFLEG